MPNVQSGPGALTGLKSFPNIAILLVCAIVALVCAFRRPKLHEISAALFFTTAIGYCLLAAFILWDCALWGCYTLHVRVLDSKREPISGITVDFLRQKGGWDLLNALLPDDVETEATTNANGEVSITTNRHQHTGGLVNMRFGLRGNGSRVNAAWRFADFNLWPRNDGKARASISWSKAGELDNSNMHVHTIEAFDPTRTTLIVFLPQDAGDDTFTY